jgi:WD40 repeat protein
VGVVYLCNVNDMKPIPVHRSEDMPFTHSFGEIRSISVFFRDDAKILITGGGEGIVRIWRFDAATSKFDQISMLEGHIRAVTCILLQGKVFSCFSS